jgi:hypothetical protein
MKPDSIEYLKMNDAMTLNGEFRWWRKESRDDKLRLLMKCISEHAVLAVSAYMPHYEYMELVKGIEMEPGTSSYGFMLQSIIKELVHRQTLFGFNEKIDFIFDNMVINSLAVL